MADEPEIIDSPGSSTSTAGTYNLAASCTNCGWAGEVRLPLGSRPSYGGYDCPRCDVRSVQAIRGEFRGRTE